MGKEEGEHEFAYDSDSYSAYQMVRRGEEDPIRNDDFSV
jgi:hypothetical protein